MYQLKKMDSERDSWNFVTQKLIYDIDLFRLLIQLAYSTNKNDQEWTLYAIWKNSPEQMEINNGKNMQDNKADVAQVWQD